MDQCTCTVGDRFAQLWACLWDNYDEMWCNFGKRESFNCSIVPSRKQLWIVVFPTIHIHIVTCMHACMHMQVHMSIALNIKLMADWKWVKSYNTAFQEHLILIFTFSYMHTKIDSVDYFISDCMHMVASWYIQFWGSTSHVIFTCPCTLKTIWGLPW